MPIFVDFSQIVVANAIVNASNHNGLLQGDLLRHQVLQYIRYARKEHSGLFGELILCMDSNSYWRKDVFPYYKANRRKNARIDWATIDIAKQKLCDEFKEVLPYRTLQVPKCEADDVIGALSKYLIDAPILILSGDHDFKQLHRGNLIQWDPTHKKWVHTDSAEISLREQIITGDVGDGVPNFLSPDDSFVSKIRQRPIMKKKVEIWVKMEPEEFCDPDALKYYYRNKQLVDLGQIPPEIVDSIINAYKHSESRVDNRSKIFNYFMQNNLRELMGSIGDFMWVFGIFNIAKYLHDYLSLIVA